MNFDEIINRQNTHSMKWDMMSSIYGIGPEDGLSMWVADMDFRPPQSVQAALQNMLDHGIYGYYGDERAYRAAIGWWMANRHGWEIEPDWIFTTHGLVNGTALCVDTYTQEGEGVVLMTPVYHAFARVIRAANRQVVECPLALIEGKYHLDIPAWDAAMTGREKMLILCSPHNPGGKVWTVEELQAIADFARRHDLILVSDEIHHDLIMPGHTHTPMAKINGIMDRLVMMTATTKTFNIAGGHSGNVIIPDAELRKRFAARMGALGISANSFGLAMAEAAYSPEGAEWVDALCAYLAKNAETFDAGIAKIPGLKPMKLEATYLSWVDFSGTGMSHEESIARVEGDARIATNYGSSFGLGGAPFLRFNLAMPHAQIEEAVARMQKAFADLQ
ncbi:putative C-S lyase [Rhodobacterales bacterium FZCC0188]|jgi:cystathionine beta-lyase|nr:putative C-S lyase [Rhodobacterales bacterium FZCC0188]